jgi:hypothetical protein
VTASAGSGEPSADMHGFVDAYSDAGILVSADIAAGGDPGAEAWVRGPLRKFIEGNGQLDELPAALAAKVGLDETRVPYRMDWPLIAELLAGAVAARGLGPRRSIAITVPAAIGIADLLARQEANRLKVPHAELAKARDAEPAVSWEHVSRGLVRFRFTLGRFAFTGNLSGHGDGTWNFGWGPDAGTDAILTAMRAGSGPWQRRPTGLFPAIDRSLRAILTEFLDRYDPESVTIAGSDAKRNAHNAATYGDLLPDVYALRPIRSAGNNRASADGVVAVEIRRLPGIEPRLPVPFERGVRTGHDGATAPDIEEARARAWPAGAHPGG